MRTKRACDSLGYTRKELLTLSLPDIVGEMDPLRVATVIENMDPGAPGTCEGFHRRKDGTIFPVEARGGPIELDGRQHVFAMVRDITDRKRSEQILIQHTSELAVLEERNRLACEIHDTLAQSLTGMVVQMEAAGDLLPRDLEAVRAEIE